MILFLHFRAICRLPSWFRIHGSVLNWFKSYLSSCSFRVNCDKDFSSQHISSCAFLMALFSVLSFLSCTLPHSALSSPHFLLTTTFTQMILNFFSHFILVTFTQVSLSLTSSPLYNRFPHGCLQNCYC